MKKTFAILLTLALAVLACACSAPVSGESGTAAQETAAPEPMAVDLDLSVLSGTVVYAQVYNIMCDPQPYLGKIIKMAGYYDAYESTERDIVYHACVIPDATACCQTGIEFVWAGEHTWPDDYPELYSEITVTGRMEEYDEDGVPYLHLVDAELIVTPAE